MFVSDYLLIIYISMFEGAKIQVHKSIFCDTSHIGSGKNLANMEQGVRLYGGGRDG